MNHRQFRNVVNQAISRTTERSVFPSCGVTAKIVYDIPKLAISAVMGGNGEIQLATQIRKNGNISYNVPAVNFFFYQYFWQKVESGVVTAPDCYLYSIQKTQNHLNAHIDYVPEYWLYPWYNANGSNLYNRVANKGIGYLPYGGN